MKGQVMKTLTLLLCSPEEEKAIKITSKTFVSEHNNTGTLSSIADPDILIRIWVLLFTVILIES
jgi:hypothetical protein